MNDYRENLINKQEAFLRETLENRMQEHGFKNLERMEKFLWDLELFQQIQKILGDKVVLKGGAATQFYLPIEAQRMSVDIDMICNASKEEIEQALIEVKQSLYGNENLFNARLHIPKKPKTNLPLYTYFVDVPSVLTLGELRKGEETLQTQEIKVEFIFDEAKPEFVKRTGEDIFAVNSELEYQLLSLNSLFADKLTTLGPNTIGVQDDRLDEQVKQFYDIWKLMQYRFREFDIGIIREKYLKRAEQECNERKKQDSFDEIKADVRKQLLRYKSVDNGNDPILKKAINDIKGFYLNSRVEFNTQVIAIAAALVELMYETILEGDDWSVVETALEVQEILQFSAYEGKARGDKLKEAGRILLEEFSSYSCIALKELKGKRPIRIFWAVVNKDNVMEIKNRLLSIVNTVSLT